MEVGGTGKMEQQGEETKVGLGKAVVVFTLCLALALGYYLAINYILMVFGQNLPFPYK